MSQTENLRPIWIVSGTRPEVIKLAPLYHALRARFGDAVEWISTGQHMELEEKTLELFGIVPDHRFERPGDEPLLEFDAHVLERLSKLQFERQPQLTVVQGDTATTFAGAFAAFHNGIPVAHVEAGLRTGNIYDPFPEEAYRKMVGTMASLLFAPTRHAAENLLAEGADPTRVLITGNTGIDALGMVDALSQEREVRVDMTLPRIAPDRRLIFVTMHRRESWGAPMERMCRAVRSIVRKHPDTEVILPVHPNPIVQRTVRSILEGEPRVHLTPPLDFVSCHRAIRQAAMVLTDSGGISEEAPSYDVPVLILRRVTERPEAVDVGVAELVGTDHDMVLREASRILDDPAVYASMQIGKNPFGDGRAAERIAKAIARYLNGESRLLSKEEQFS